MYIDKTKNPLRTFLGLNHEHQGKAERKEFF